MRQFRLVCQDCGYNWMCSTQIVSICPNCQKRTRNRAYPIEANVNAIGTKIFRLGCRKCNSYWLDGVREAPCPKCGHKSTSSKPERITGTQIKQIRFRIPLSFLQITRLLNGSLHTCPECGQMIDLEQESYCSSCGTSLMMFYKPEAELNPDSEMNFNVTVRAFCSECGAEISPRSKLCPCCGTFFEEGYAGENFVAFEESYLS